MHKLDLNRIQFKSEFGFAHHWIQPSFGMTTIRDVRDLFA